MKMLMVFSILIWTLTGCMQSGGGPDTSILYANAVGMYDGRCVNADPQLSAFSNTSTSGASIVAISPSTASLRVDCTEIGDRMLAFVNASAATVQFRHADNEPYDIDVVYYADRDSLVVTIDAPSAGDGRVYAFLGSRR